MLRQEYRGQIFKVNLSTKFASVHVENMQIKTLFKRKINQENGNVEIKLQTIMSRLTPQGGATPSTG